MKILPKFNNQNGFTPILFLLAALGLLIFLFITNTFSFKDRLFNNLFPKPPSHAEELTRGLTNNLLQTAKEYKFASADKKDEVLAKLKEVAVRRKEVMLDAASSNPDVFVANTLSPKVRNKLPKEVAEFLEERVSVNGEVNVTIFDDFEKGTSTTRYQLDKYNLIFAKGKPPPLSSGDQVSVSGFALDNTLVMGLNSTSDTISIQSAPQRVSAPTEHKVAIELINFSDNTNINDTTGQPITVDNVRNNFFASSPSLSVDSYYRQNSFNKIYFSGQVFDWKTIDSPSTSCTSTDYYRWANLADKANYINPRNYDHIVYVFPRVGACIAGDPVTKIAWAEVGGKRSWFNGENIPFIFNHEIGHNLGLAHADVLSCDSSATQSKCAVLNIQDFYSTMGLPANSYNFSYSPHFNTPEKDGLNWANVQTVGKSGTYSVIPLELNTASTHALKIPFNKRKNNYYIEYRQSIDFDSTPFMGEITGGVSIHLWNGTLASDTQLLYLPELKKIFSERTSSTIPAVSLIDGESFYDQNYGIKVKQISHSTTKATVEVTFGKPQCANHTPSLTVFTSDDTTYPGGSVRYDVTVTNNDSSACPLTEFYLQGSVPDGWNNTFSPSTLSILPGQSGNASWTVTSLSAEVDGVYDVTAVTINSASISLSDSQTAKFTISSSEIPPPSPAPTSEPTIQPSPSPAQCGTFITKWGSQGSGDGQFNYPGWIAIDVGNNVYVTDLLNQRVQKFTSSGGFITKWGSQGSGDGQFYTITGIAVDSGGNVYVADAQHNTIQKFTSSGGFITKWGSFGTRDGQFNYPSGIAVDAGNNIYVADADNHRIQKFTSSGGFITKWGLSGQFDSPHAIAVDSGGNVYVTDPSSNTIQKFTSSGGFITKWGSLGSSDGQFNFPFGIAVDSGGNVYVADDNNARIQKFTSSGGFITKWGSQGSGDGQFISPDGVAIDAGNNIYVVDKNNSRIQKFSCIP